MGRIVRKICLVKMVRSSSSRAVRPGLAMSWPQYCTERVVKSISLVDQKPMPRKPLSRSGRRDQSHRRPARSSFSIFGSMTWAASKPRREVSAAKNPNSMSCGIMPACLGPLWGVNRDKAMSCSWPPIALDPISSPSSFSRSFKPPQKPRHRIQCAWCGRVP